MANSNPTSRISRDTLFGHKHQYNKHICHAATGGNADTADIVILAGGTLVTDVEKILRRSSDSFSLNIIIMKLK